jgi:hypothetical protein
MQRLTIAGALAWAVLMTVLAGASLTGYVQVYNGLNKGVVVGNCGLEVVGHPGFFCGDY